MQNIAEEFWRRYSLQTRQKWNDKRSNFEVGNIVILKERDCQRKQWPLARITGVNTDRNDSVQHRVADLNNEA